MDQDGVFITIGSLREEEIARAEKFCKLKKRCVVFLRMLRTEYDRDALFGP